MLSGHDANSLNIIEKYFVILHGKHYENLTKISSHACCSLKEMSKSGLFYPYGIWVEILGLQRKSG